MISRTELAGIVFIALATFGWAAEFTGIVAFGDSLSDTGNRWLDPKKTDIKFKQTWVALLTVSHPTLKIIKLDLFARFNEVAAEPAKFGFTDVTTGANDDKHLFSADGLHPTTQGHRMFAPYAFTVLSAKAAGAQ